MASSQLSHHFQGFINSFKSLNGASPSYLVDRLHYLSRSGTLRSVANELLDQPRSFTKTYGDKAFSVCTPRLWNNLPLYRELLKRPLNRPL